MYAVVNKKIVEGNVYEMKPSSMAFSIHTHTELCECTIHSIYAASIRISLTKYVIRITIIV